MSKKKIMLGIGALATLVVLFYMFQSNPLPIEPYQEPQKCWNKPLNIEMGDFLVNLDNRGKVNIAVNGSKNIDNLQFKCDIEKIKNAVGVATGFINISLDESVSDFTKTLRKRPLALVKGQESETLVNGTKKYQVGGRQIYILPYQENRTYNEVPVAIVCIVPDGGKRISPTNRCLSLSRHSSGLYVGYDFWRKSYEEIEFLDLDNKKIKKFNEIVSRIKG